MLVVQIDVVRTEPLQRAFDCYADVRRTAIEHPGTTAGVRDDAKLRRQHHLVAAALDGPADQLLVDVWTIDLGGVDVGNAQVQRPMDGANGLGIAACPNVVVAGHGHRAESYARDFESADRDVLHGDGFQAAPFLMRQCRRGPTKSVCRI